MSGKWNKIVTNEKDQKKIEEGSETHSATRPAKRTFKAKNQAIIYYASQGIPDEEIAKSLNTSLFYVQNVIRNAQKVGLLPEQQPQQQSQQQPQQQSQQQPQLQQPLQQVLPPLQPIQQQEIPEELQLQPATFFPLPHVPGLHPNEVLNKFLEYARVYGKGQSISPQMAELISKIIMMEYALQAARISTGGGEMIRTPDGYPDRYNETEFIREMKEVMKQVRMMKMQERIAKMMGIEDEDSINKKVLERLEKLEKKQEEDKILSEIKRLENLALKGGDEKELSKLRELERKIEELKEDKRLEELKLVLGSKHDITDKIEKMYSERDKAMEAVRDKLDETRTQLIITQMTNALNKLEDRVNQLQGTGAISSKLAEIKETISAIKELASTFGVAKEESEAERVVNKVVTPVLDKIKGPILEPVGEALAEKIKAQPPPQQLITIPKQEIEETELMPSTEQPITIIPEKKNEYSNLVRVI